MNSELGYRPCVGIMLLNRDNEVWVGRRLERDGRGEQYDGGDWWQMPQGGIDGSEVPEAAARRELHEETGISGEQVELLSRTAEWVQYDLPEELIGKVWGGRYRGQKQLWYLMRFIGEDAEINIGPRGGIKAEFDAWKWVPVGELHKLVIPFKRNVYESVLREFAGLTGAG